MNISRILKPSRSTDTCGPPIGIIRPFVTRASSVILWRTQRVVFIVVIIMKYQRSRISKENLKKKKKYEIRFLILLYRKVYTIDIIISYVK